MTTITIENAGELAKTNFHDVQELAQYLAQYQFETDLEQSIQKGMETPTEQFTRI